MRSALFLGRDPFKAKEPAVVSIPREGLVAMLSCASFDQFVLRCKGMVFAFPYLDKNWNAMHCGPNKSLFSLLVKLLGLFE